MILQKILSDDSEIEWSPEFRVTTNHFRGSPDPDNPHDANSHTGVNYLFKSKVEKIKNRHKIFVEDIWVRSYFYTESSWLRVKLSGEINIDKLMKHEQGHFDLAEKFARKIDRKLKNKFRNKSRAFKTSTEEETKLEMKQIIQLEFEKLFEKLKRAHIQYDKVTKHGTISSEQEKFDARFASLRQERT